MRGMEIKKISEVKFEIPRDENAGMNGGVTFYATEEMFDKMKKDSTVQQAINATTLPGLVGNVLVMPDGHQGYGFPVGGVAAFDAENGIISPGAVGFDINCLHPDTKVSVEDGCWKRIEELKNEKVLVLDRVSGKTITAQIALSMKRTEKDSLFLIRSRFRKELIVTGDHPILTRNGMVLAKNLTTQDELVSSGFEGVEYTQTVHHKRIVGIEELNKAMDALSVKKTRNARTQMVNYLRERDLVDIYSDHPKLGTICKVFGFLIGDGTIPRGKGRVNCYGKERDLYVLKADFEKLGFNGNVNRRERHHSITTAYGNSAFDFEEFSLAVPSNALRVLLVALGAPFGNRSSTDYKIPDWIINAEPWQKRLFLSAYFGAEMTKPIVAPGGYNFACPLISINKLETLSESAIAFLNQLASMLLDFGVTCSDIRIVEGYRYNGKHGITVGYRLRINSETQNLIRFFSTVGYSYNSMKEELASFAVLYLTMLEQRRTKLDRVRTAAIVMHNKGISTKEIVGQLSSEDINESFIAHSTQGRIGAARIWEMQGFSDFCKANVAAEGFLYDKVADILRFPHDGYVYDITVANENHNFLADGAVVSNCGVRLIKTNLTEKDIKSKIKAIADALFKNVPTGVGSKLNIGFKQEDLERVAQEGAEYAIGKGYGIPGDVESIEENGRLDGADFSKVSKDAKRRGLNQLGTLGAGNHFLEVQKVEKLFDKEVAKSYGLFEDQIVIMVHTGSRGFGHQICSDFLRSLVTYQQEHGIKLVDRELSYAQVGSREAADYIKAMNCAVNFAFTNRQMITHLVRQSFSEVFGKSSDALGMELLYDVAHNIAKPEMHTVDGQKRMLYIHRKGATRAYPKGMKEIPKKYRSVGQPVIIPGSMSTGSYVLCGMEGSMTESFGSACHGSGRVMSRHQAIREIPAAKTFETLREKHVEIRVKTRGLISEEAEWAYKNPDDVVGVVEKAGLAKIVSKNKPMIVIKG